MSYNNLYGHEQGNQCLIKIAQILQDSVSHLNCLTARYGGDEFGIILPNINHDQAEEIMITICNNVVKEKIQFNALLHGLKDGAIHAKYVTIRVAGQIVIPTEKTSPKILFREIQEKLNPGDRPRLWVN
jgi:GGDEF domain-containing protein